MHQGEGDRAQPVDPPGAVDGAVCSTAGVAPALHCAQQAPTATGEGRCRGHEGSRRGSCVLYTHHDAHWMRASAVSFASPGRHAATGNERLRPGLLPFARAARARGSGESNHHLRIVAPCIAQVAGALELQQSSVGIGIDQLQARCDAAIPGVEADLDLLSGHPLPAQRGRAANLYREIALPPRDQERQRDALAAHQRRPMLAHGGVKADIDHGISGQFQAALARWRIGILLPVDQDTAAGHLEQHLLAAAQVVQRVAARLRAGCRGQVLAGEGAPIRALCTSR
ncbi:hypothetical protein G6F59_013874 [Rhizopus arrhizus]|nr:hypothetical protein G6F59_013874 [Rhizopus arrhizus]